MYFHSIEVIADWQVCWKFAEITKDTSFLSLSTLYAGLEREILVKLPSRCSQVTHKTMEESGIPKWRFT